MQNLLQALSAGRVVVAMMFLIGVSMHGQSEGNNVIYSGSSIAASSAYIDAMPFTTGDICTTIYNILSPLSITSYPSGVTVDARGILPPGGTGSITCQQNPFSTKQYTSYVTVPSTVLLPGANISVSLPWVLPSNTRIIGEGSGTQNFTALGNFGSLGCGAAPACAMIVMGTGSAATGVVVQHLILNGGAGTPLEAGIDGIDNFSAGDGSYVDDVDIVDFEASSNTAGPAKSQCGTAATTSLCISTGATYSGPYTNIFINPGTSSASTCQLPSGGGNGTCAPTACVKIQAQTRGLHGITCIATSASTKNGNNLVWPAAAIYLDSYATSIHDVHVEGYQDGIIIGDYSDGLGNLANQTVTANTIANVVGATGAGPVKNAIHICNPSAQSGICAAATSQFTGTNNFTVLQATSNGTGNAIEDDYDANTNGIGLLAGLYAVGNTSPYGRFTTMPGNMTATPTWGVGSAISGSCSNSGAIFSNPSGTSGSNNTIYVCSGGNWTAIGQ